MTDDTTFRERYGLTIAIVLTVIGAVCYYAPVVSAAVGRIAAALP